MIKTIIIDDEEPCRMLLSDLINKSFSDKFQLLTLCKSAAEGIDAINSFQPDLVFLDVEMPVANGFQMLSRIKKHQEINFNVVFTTAHDKYAIHAIKLSAFDFFLKPVNKNDMLAVLLKFNEKMLSETKMKMEVLLDNNRNIENQKSLKDFGKIALTDKDGTECINICDILRLEGDGNYTTFYLSNKKRILISKNLKIYDDLLNGEGFFRVHASHLINLRFVNKYTREGKVKLDDGTFVDVAVSRRSEFLKLLKET